MVLKTLMFICLICHQVEWFWDLFLKWVAQRGYCCWKKSSFHKKLYSKNPVDEREIFVRSGNSPPFPNERPEFCVFVQNSHICRFQLLLLSSITKGGIQKIKMEILDGICHQGSDPPPLIFFYPTFFLLQLNPTYMKRILHFKNITFESSYNWFKIDIHQQLRPLTANYLAMFKVISTTIYT